LEKEHIHLEEGVPNELAGSDVGSMKKRTTMLKTA
jgi:hypothetical protein